MFLRIFNKKHFFIFSTIFIFIFLLFIFLTTYSIVLSTSSQSEKKDTIKWVDFKVTSEALSKTSNIDIISHTEDGNTPLNWISLLSYLACKYGGDFNKFKQSDLDNLVQELQSGNSIESLIQNQKQYDYYYTCYDAILNQFIGDYEIEDKNAPGTFKKDYGLKAFLPIAKKYSFSHYPDFGASRSYGFTRRHLGNDLMGSIGTPIIAVESGVIEALGWNQYGGWRIGIRSLDKRRYYYYAHLRKDHPFAYGLQEGDLVKAGDVIGYLGMTGYSTTENVNNINIPHLHFGMQLIFDESQKDGNNEIWIDVYPIVEFLQKNRSEVYLAYPQSKDYERKYDFMEPTFYE